MTITYEVGDGLYINMTNRCTNACDFCIRKNGAGAYHSEPLWLEREPTVEEILADIEKRNPADYREIVFCGYGEPTCRLPELLSVCEVLKKKYPSLPIRLNTNGQSDLIWKKDTSPLYKGKVDAISISLNHANAEDYVRVCHPVYGKDAYQAILTFASHVKKSVPDVAFSVVRGFLPEEDIAVCQHLADEAGIRLRVREYIPPND